MPEGGVSEFEWIEIKRAKLKEGSRQCTIGWGLLTTVRRLDTRRSS
jgi:hypothetical protein